MSEQYLRNTDLKWTIFRPSTIFGDPRGNGRPEFCSQLKKDLINLPFPAPLFHEDYCHLMLVIFLCLLCILRMSQQALLVLCKNEKTELKTIELGGQDFTWKEIIQIIGSASGKKSLWFLLQ